MNKNTMYNRKQIKRGIIIGCILLILGIIVLYLNIYRSIPQIKTQNIYSAKIESLKDQSEINLTTEKAQKMSEEISSHIPNNNEYHYWNDFSKITKKDKTEYQVTFYNKQDEIEYQYEIRLAYPSYAKVLKGDVQFWQVHTYPLTGYDFDSFFE